MIANILATFGLACLVGGMLFFSAIMAPLVFTQLPLDIAGPFIRVTFPCYYGFVIASALIGAAGNLLQRQRTFSIVLLSIAAVTLWLLFWFIPHLNTLRLSGNAAALARGHRLSVWINGAELLAASWLLVKHAIDTAAAHQRAKALVPD